MIFIVLFLHITKYVGAQCLLLKCFWALGSPSDNVCELRREKYSIFRDCLHFPELAIDICLVEALGHKLSASKIHFYLHTCPGLINFLLPFQKPIKNPAMLVDDDNDDDDDDNIIIAATNSYIACYRVPDSFRSILQSLTYLILKTNLWDRHHRPPH